MDKHLQKLYEMNQKAEDGGGIERKAKQREKGKRTVMMSAVRSEKVASVRVATRRHTLKRKNKMAPCTPLVKCRTMISLGKRLKRMKRFSP